LKINNFLKNLAIGFHDLAPNSGEITQGYGLGMTLGATEGS
jgi:hypothetical protein